MNGIFKIVKKNRTFAVSTINRNFSYSMRKQFKSFGNTHIMNNRNSEISKNNFYKIKSHNFSNKNENDDEKDNKEKKEDEKLIQKQEMVKKLVEINLWLLLSFGVTALYFLKHNSEKEVTFEDFARYVQEKKIMDIEIKKGMDVFYYVFAELKDKTKVKVKILDNESFIRTLERIQLEMGLSFEDFIPLRFSDEIAGNNFLWQVGLFSIYAIVSYRIYRTVDKYNHLKSTGLHFKKTKSKTEKDTNSNNFMDKLMGAKDDKKFINMVDKIDIRFADVAGLESAKKEISEFVEFIKNKNKFTSLGARIPRGVLLEGPPGTGKTLLAKAVAGEAGVPFFASSGSDFVEMYVGMGAKRIRKLFAQAKEKSPSIIFIDEIDSIGKARTNSDFSNSEREETLNQLLVEMDGFDTDQNVIVICATNRNDLLDKALTRSGRLDRVVQCNLPDRKEREDIAKVYLKKVMLDETTPINEYASRIAAKTPGFSGADLANLVNEAAIISARENKNSVDLDSFEKSYDRKISGLSVTQPINAKERKIMAYHHASKVIVAWFSEHSNPFLKVNIIPKQKSGGFEHSVEDDKKLHTKEQILDNITINLTGKVAEEFFFGTSTDHSSGNLIRATKIAYKMLTKWGMSESSLQTYDIEGEIVSDISENTFREIDSEVQRILQNSVDIIKNILTIHRELVDKLANELIEKEALDLKEIIKILGDRPYPMPIAITDYLNQEQKVSEP